jgi:dihydroorotate dehydrogenase electron transfer subunit
MDINFELAVVTKNECIAPDIFAMTVSAPLIAKAARAGQFVMVYLNRGELLLPRPISICDADADAGTVELVYQVVGKGTRVMAEMFYGLEIKLLGALGNGFFLKNKDGKEFSRVALVGGGIGVPPLLLLAKAFRRLGVETDVFLGFRSAPVLLEEFRAVADRVFVSTEDGSFGNRGYITEVLQAQTCGYDEILACGPLPLLYALADYAKSENIPCQISMEQRMACGLGTCVGCVVKVGEGYVRVCKEGPVFYSE